MVTSLSAALLTTLVATVFGTLAAYGINTVKSRLMQAMYVVFMLPLIIPGILIAIGIFLLFANLGLNNTLAGIVLAHSVMAIPLVVITVTSGMKTYDMGQEMAARSLGASRTWAFLTVTLPQIKLSVISGALLAFITSLDEVVISLFIAGGDRSTLTKRMFNTLRDELDPTIASISTLLLAIALALLVTTRLIQRSAERSQSGKRKQ